MVLSDIILTEVGKINGITLQLLTNVIHFIIQCNSYQPGAYSKHYGMSDRDNSGLYRLVPVVLPDWCLNLQYLYLLVRTIYIRI